MLKLNFYSVKEKKPRIGQEIVYLKARSSFGYEGFELKYGKVEGCYTEYQDNEESGMVFCATKYGKKPIDYINAAGEAVTYVLTLQVGHNFIDDAWYWTTEDKYWASFDKAELKEKI